MSKNIKTTSVVPAELVVESAAKFNIFSAFEHHLQNRDVSILTLRGYLSDVQQFARWFEQTNNETFRLPTVTPSDVRGYRQFLQGTEKRKATTVNRKLAALNSLMSWGIQSG